MKPVKNLISNQGECHSVNPLTGFVGAMSGNMEKVRLMGASSEHRPVTADSARVSASSLQTVPRDVPNFYEMSNAPQINQRGSEWSAEFMQSTEKPSMVYPSNSSHMMMTNSFGPMGPMMYPMYAPTPTYPSSDLSAAKRMVDLMRSSGNPKFANSNFVEFIDQVANGNLHFEEGNGGAVVDRSGQHVDWDALYTTPPDEEGLPDQMEHVWNELQGGFLATTPTLYEFQHRNNAYIESSENLLALASRLISEGKDKEAMVVLEAEVRVNPDSSEGWRMLGELHAQFDQDVLAISCLEQGHLCDSFNLDAMLALGVSLTNELDSIRALTILQKWISSHERFHLLASVNLPTDYAGLRREVLSNFLEARKIDPQNSDVLVALGVLYNISREYSLAIPVLMEAARLRPLDSAVWNKLGATLANSGLSKESLNVYHQALFLKPNYSRALANLAIAHTNLGEYEEASRNFLKAIQSSPSSHLWSSLFLALSHFAPDRIELADMVEKRDVDALVRAIGTSNVARNNNSEEILSELKNIL